MIETLQAYVQHIRETTPWRALDIEHSENRVTLKHATFEGWQIPEDNGYSTDITANLEVAFYEGHIRLDFRCPPDMILGPNKWQSRPPKQHYDITDPGSFNQITEYLLYIDTFLLYHDIRTLIANTCPDATTLNHLRCKLRCKLRKFLQEPDPDPLAK